MSGLQAITPTRKPGVSNRIVFASVSLLALISASGARAQATAAAAASAPVKLDEVVVTAQKRVERVVDVPMSVDAMSGRQLARSGISDVAQLSKVVPGFGYQQSAFGAPVLSIRGVGFYDNAFAAGPTVTAYVDQVVLPYSVETRGASLDLDRVEVLKGPQGTLFGMNSTGGAINYIAAKPTKSFAAGADLSYGSYNDVNASGFVSGPLADGLTARLALQHERADGWQHSMTRPDDVLGAKDFTNGRLLVDYKPSDRLSFEFGLSGWRDGSQGQAAQFEGFYPAVAVTPVTQFIADAMNASPIAPHKASAADWAPGQNFKRNDNFYQISLRADWRVTDAVTLTSITAYTNFMGQDPMDIDGTAFVNFAQLSHSTLLSTVSQELRLAGTAGALKWMVGANYQGERTHEAQLTENQGTNNQIGPYLFTHLGEFAIQRTQTGSAFGSLDWQATDRLTLQASLRYSAQYRAFDGCVTDAGPGPEGVSAAEAFGFLSSILSGTPTTIQPGGCVTMDPTTFKPTLAVSKLDQDNLSWRVGAKWKLDQDGMIYVNATKGYKSGSYSMLPAILASQFTPVTQESVLAYEAGFKQSLFEHRLEVTGAVFYDDYWNKQLEGYVLTPVFGTLPELVNIPKSDLFGVEAEVTARPINGVRLSAGATYVASRVGQDPTAPAVPRTPFGAVTSYVGEAFPNTPMWQATSDAEYDFPLGMGDLTGYVGGSVSYRGPSFAGFGEAPQFRLPAYTLLDLRIGVESPGGRWSAQVWGHNVTNQYYWTNVSHLTDYLSRLAGMPATWGVSLSYRY
ncbi:MAG: TonB-dependent receptor [Caulobacteraceae bacterium]|nr:TonB-dependent receptor [Caulobacteraceae bacterium]